MPGLGESISRVSRDEHTVLVVGAGVSGCACAAVLAEQGVDVTLLNSALDRVNLPAYGSELVAGAEGWAEIRETMAMLPMPLRQAWLSSAAVPEDGAPVVIIDRRAVSVETKRALERVPGLRFKQGLVTDLRLGGPRRGEDPQGRGSQEEESALVTVGTVFGETFEADAVVLAVGLGLGGVVAVGDDSLHGGRYGETPADGLKDALEALGAKFRVVGLEVGARYVGDGMGLIETVTRADGNHTRQKTVDVRKLVLERGRSGSVGELDGLEEARSLLASTFPGGWPAGADRLGDESGADDSGCGWPASFPPAVHWSKGFPLEEMVVGVGGDEVRVPLVSPDGRATEEIHLSREGADVLRTGETQGRGATETVGTDAPSLTGLEVSRPGYSVRALAVQSVGEGGRLELGRGATASIWVAGRAAGASGYLSSLRSGALAGAAIARTLLKAGLQEQGACR